MKRSYRIRKINTYNEYLSCYLDNNVDYKDGSINCITLTNKSPFDNLKVGDVIYINTDEVISHTKNTVMGSGIVNKSEF